METKKSLIALALVALVGIVGGTYAYFTSTAKLTNEFTTGTYETTIREEFESPSDWTPGTTTPKVVNVTNEGSVDVAVRAKVEETWMAADGTSLPTVRDDIQVAQYAIGYNWILAEDGYYYYKDTLARGETSNNFISSVTFNPYFSLKDGQDIECTKTTVDGKTTVNCVNLTSGYAGATYRMSITIETVQADRKWDYKAVKTLFYWGYGSTALASVEDVTLQIGDGQSVTTSLVKVCDNVYEPEEMEGLTAINVYNTGESAVSGIYSYDDVLYETEDYFYVSADFTGPFFVVLNEFGELTPGVWMSSENNPTWDSLQYIASTNFAYVIAK